MMKRGVPEQSELYEPVLTYAYQVTGSTGGYTYFASANTTTSHTWYGITP